MKYQSDEFVLTTTDIPKPVLIEFDPERNEPWPMPAGGKWEPKPSKSLRDVFADMADRVGLS